MLYGWHASLILEIATTLIHVLQGRGRQPVESLIPIQFDATFCGAYYPAGSLGLLRAAIREGPLSGEIAHEYRSWIGDFLDDYVKWVQPSKIEAASKRLIN